MRNDVGVTIIYLRSKLVACSGLPDLIIEVNHSTKTSNRGNPSFGKKKDKKGNDTAFSKSKHGAR